MSNLRKSGIDVLGDIPMGSHFCNFYETKQDLLDTLIPYFKAGLENKEYCIWVVSNSELITAEEAKGALKKVVPDLEDHLSNGNIEILKEVDWYLEENMFNIERVTKAWIAKLKLAMALGYKGMRVSGDTFWLRENDRKDFSVYEKQINDSITDLPMTVLCTYPLAKSGAAEILDVAHTHQFAIARRLGEWEVLVTQELIQEKAEIKRFNEELEQRVIKRTQELAAANEELRREIAERKHAEALLYAKEQEFRAIVENTPDQIVRFNREFIRTYVNPALAKVYGLPVEALIGTRLGSFIQEALFEINKDELTKIEQRITDVFYTGKSCEYELNWQIPGSRKYFSVRLFPELDLNGSINNVLGIAQDITVRKQAEDELRLAYQRLSYHVENTPLAVIECDKELYIKRWSTHAEEIFGWKASEALGKNFYDPEFPILYEEDTPDQNKIAEQLVNGIVNWKSLNRNYTKDGNVIYCEWYNSVLRDEHNNVITILSLVLNVTERKKAEETLNQSYEEIRLLTEHLQKIREEERTYIAREIHDELGQQLTVLNMDVSWLNKKLNDADESIKLKIKDLINLLEAMVKSVRRISSELRPSLLDNLGLVAAMEWHLREFEKRSGVKIMFNEPKEELEVPDSIKNSLFRIFQESLTNVARHSNAKMVKVEFLQKNDEIILSIEDDGDGFEKQNAAEKETLGILGMKERAMMMGGSYEINSVPGKGTAVTVVLPYKIETLF